MFHIAELTVQKIKALLASGKQPSADAAQQTAQRILEKKQSDVKGK